MIHLSSSSRLLRPLLLPLCFAGLFVDLPAEAQASGAQAAWERLGGKGGNWERLARSRERASLPVLGPRSTPEATLLWADFYARTAHDGDSERLPHDLYL
ncbi:MAG: hypothetical protein MI919_14830, partial [Holophagales bacterium]|nr:hypothetical protein [Holophagales bacterium]